MMQRTCVEGGSEGRVSGAVPIGKGNRIDNRSDRSGVGSPGLQIHGSGNAESLFGFQRLRASCRRYLKRPGFEDAAHLRIVGGTDMNEGHRLSAGRACDRRLPVLQVVVRMHEVPRIIQRQVVTQRPPESPYTMVHRVPGGVNGQIPAGSGNQPHHSSRPPDRMQAGRLRYDNAWTTPEKIPLLPSKRRL